MVYRIYSEKKKEFANEASSLLSDLRNLLGVTGLTSLRLINRYDVENIGKELFDSCRLTVFSEPQVDDAYDSPDTGSDTVFAVEYLPGQFDQRADSASQCIQIISQGERPLVRTAKLYSLGGDLTDADIAKIKKYVINPVEAREAALAVPDTLRAVYSVPESVPALNGFISLDDAGLSDIIKKYSLAMDLDDIRFCRDHFASEKRDPTLTEIRILDTYWSDHCRHTTFLTTVDNVTFDDPAVSAAYERYIAVRKKLGRTKPVNLMDIATIGAKALRSEGKLDKLDISDEINACTVKMKVTVDGEAQDWLLLFKNETHNHPTEIEPFGGAATCIGGAIRDPLSGRAYVYGAMRVTGAADPTKPVSETLAGKLPQRKIVTTAAAGYSSYGNQIGLATGTVDEIYHPGYAAKRMEIGAVIAAVPEENVRRECPTPGDAVILLGGRTGRDGCGGATGSSKKHTSHSLESCGAEVQKGNAPVERKLQRLFRSKRASLLIKRCNDFGAGGVSVAIGELADGLKIDLNKVPKKYEGLDGTELAISESQERMAVVVAAADVNEFLSYAKAENLEATVVAEVTADPRLVMYWNGVRIADIPRSFLDSNGAEKHTDIRVPKQLLPDITLPVSFSDGMKALASDLNICSKRGLAERFDSTIGAGTVVMPFGGVNQLTPTQAMIQKISCEKGHTDCCSFMSWGYDPSVSEKSPYRGAYLAVVSSVCKLIASGAEFRDVYLTLQEYFEKPGKDPQRWGQPMAALLGALDAQLDLGIAAIGGKDSMSGSFEALDVPPTLVSFAVTTGKVSEVVTPEFKKAGHRVALISAKTHNNGLPDSASLKALFNLITYLARSGKAASVYSVGHGGTAEAIMKMCFGNNIGFAYAANVGESEIFTPLSSSFVIELTDGELPDGAILLGATTEDECIIRGKERISLSELLGVYEDRLEDVFPCNIKQPGKPSAYSYTAASRVSPVTHTAKPRALIPVFPGTNCEYDTAKALSDAGADAEIFVINNLSPSDVAASADRFASLLRKSHIVVIPGGFSGGDEPEGSGKFITAFFRNAAVKDAVTELLDDRGGLMCGICNGFQALIKLGLVPYGKITDAAPDSPTLTFNIIGRHQSRLVRTRVASDKSPWLSLVNTSDIFTVPISHGEGRFTADEETVAALAANGQIATQYVDLSGKPTEDIHFNPNGSVAAIEGITSPDGRVFGKMGHTERTGSGLYLNVPGNYDMKLFESAVRFFN